MKTIQNNKIPSIFKDNVKVAYDLAGSLKKGSKVLLPDGYDGWNALVFASKGHEVTIYEPDLTYINGGYIYRSNHKIEIKGLKKRIETYEYDNVHYINSNFYTDLCKETYDFVFVYNSLHRNTNSTIPIKEKIEKLKEVTKKDGRIYFSYLLATDELDEINYPNNSFLKQSEIMSYFNLKDWKIVFARERLRLRKFESCIHDETSDLYKVGYLHICKSKRNKELNHRYRYNIRIKNT